MEWKTASEYAIRSIQLFFHVTRHSRVDKLRRALEAGSLILWKIISLIMLINEEQYGI